MLGSNISHFSREGWGRVLGFLNILNEWLAQPLHYCEWVGDQICWVENRCKVELIEVLHGEKV